MAWVNDKGEVVDLTPAAPAPANDRDMYRTLDVICEMCWQTHIAWEKIIGENPKRNWDELNDQEKQSVRDSVLWFIDHPSASLAAEHDAWRSRKLIPDSEHINLVRFDELPFPQQMKLRIWRHITLAVIG